MAEQLAATPRGGIDINTLDTNSVDTMFDSITANLADVNAHGEEIIAEQARHRAEKPGSVAVADIIARVQRERQAEANLNLQDMVEEEQAETTRHKLHGAPEGFLSTEDALRDEKELGRGKLGLFQRARLLMGAPNRAIMRGYSRLMDRRARKAAEFDSLSTDDKNRRMKKITATATLGAAAVLSAMLAQKLNGSQEFAGMPTVAALPEAESDVDLAIEADTLQGATDFIYDPSQDVFNNPDRKAFNFRAALDATTPETAAKDLTDGWKTNPLQFAAALGAFGIIDNTQESIEATAQQMLTNPELFAANYDQIQAMVNSSSTSIDAPFGGAYGSYGMFTDDAGNQRLVFNDNVYDPQMILTFHTPNGPVCYGMECGQVIYLPSPAESAPVIDLPQGGGELPAPAPIEAPVVYVMTQPTEAIAPQGGGPIPEAPVPVPTPVEPATPVVSTPPPTIPTPPVIPEVTVPTVPPPIDLPPVLAPKGEAYPSDQWDVPLGPGEYMPEPVEVETEVITPVERPGIDQAPIVDSFTEPEAAETGGSAPGTTTGGLDTSGNSGPSELEDASTKADSSNTTGGSSSSSSGAGETSSSNQTSETGTVESR